MHSIVYTIVKTEQQQQQQKPVTRILSVRWYSGAWELEFSFTQFRPLSNVSPRIEAFLQLVALLGRGVKDYEAF